MALQHVYPFHVDIAIAFASEHTRVDATSLIFGDSGLTPHSHIFMLILAIYLLVMMPIWHREHTDWFSGYREHLNTACWRNRLLILVQAVGKFPGRTGHPKLPASKHASVEHLKWGADQTAERPCELCDQFNASVSYPFGGFLNQFTK